MGVVMGLGMGSVIGLGIGLGRFVVAVFFRELVRTFGASARGLAVVALLVLAGCRGCGEPPGGGRTDAALDAGETDAGDAGDGGDGGRLDASDGGDARP
ncbi:hypothetical protein L6R52_32510, partial [Myxococcota bacterium]|nr:hypothetical protein [Myxococcota bacterium]